MALTPLHGYGIALALQEGMLVRYCATHLRHFGYPRLLGVRWNGWVVSTVGGLCEACRERERDRWEANPYGEVLIPAPVELGPRMLVRRVIVATVAASAAGMVATAALLVAQPPDLIPSGGEPGQFSSGARLAEPPLSTQADTETEQPAASRQSRPERAVPRVVASRAAHPSKPIAVVATPVRLGGGCAAPMVTQTRAVPMVARPVASPAVIAAQSP
jgi:hypothetical protein